MKFLANENFPYPSIEILRAHAYEVKSILEDHRGMADLEVVALAKKSNLIILTFDRDYGEIIYKYKASDPPSVVYFRYKGKKPDQAGSTLVDLIEAGLKISGFFTVIEAGGIRQRKL